MKVEPTDPVIVIGGGPAGLTAAYELTKHHLRPLVLEQQDKVGGLSRTETYKGYHFDMGGHRFFTKAQPVNQMWHEILSHELLLRPRLSRIYYRGKFFNYPLKPLNALFGLGPGQAVLIGLSFLRWQLFPYRHEETFEQWVTNRFGQRLFLTFFKTYTEKVWGIPTSELKAEWAAQRIKDLSLKTALLSMFVKPKTKIKTLIEEFHYPRFGPGMLWGAVREEVERRGGRVDLNTEVIRIHRNDSCIESIVVRRDGHEETVRGSAYISSMPVADFVKRLDPVPDEVLQAARRLNYRDFLTVGLIINQAHLFPDNWIYVHSPEVKVGRIQNFKNWSPDMVPDASKTSLGLEYFCNEGDAVWSLPDAELIELAKREVAQIGLARYEEVEDGCVFRVPKAYPVYDADYREYLDSVRAFVDGLDNFQTIGRNGLHRYNNQDHAMMTGMLAVRNLVLGEQNDLWSVNTDQAYHEEIQAEDLSGADAEAARGLRVALRHVFPRLDPLAFGLAAGVVSGAGLFFATLFLVAKGGPNVGTYLQLLNNFFPGYSVTLPGSVWGLVYALITGFALGSIFAYLRNVAVYLSAVIIHRDLELGLLRRLLDYV